MDEHSPFGELSPSTEAYRQFRKIYPDEAEILEDPNYTGWKITKQVSTQKWEAFLAGYQSSIETPHDQGLGDSTQ